MNPLKHPRVAWCGVVLAATAGLLEACPSGTGGAQIIRKPGLSGPPPAPTVRGRARIDAKTLSLHQLVELADRIVIGTVVGLELTIASISEDGVTATVPVREVTLSVERALKGSLQAGQLVRVRQLVSLSAPLQPRETVMWFLPAESPVGLTQPLGLYSGDFRINTEDPARPAVNLRQNEGLWRDSLWAGDGFERAAVLGTAAAFMSLPQEAQTRIDRAAAINPQPAGVPLDLLISATLSQLGR